MDLFMCLRDFHRFGQCQIRIVALTIRGVRECLSTCIYNYMYIYIFTYTHIYIYIYLYICFLVMRDREGPSTDSSPDRLAQLICNGNGAEDDLLRMAYLNAPW